MQIKNINKTIFENGGTSDIIKVVMMAYDIENDPQIEVLARKLQGKNNTATARNIWQYLIENINYRADVEFTVDPDVIAQEALKQLIAQNLQNSVLNIKGLITANNKKIPFDMHKTITDFKI